MLKVNLTEQDVEMIKSMCDLTLRQTGIQNLNQVIAVLNALGNAEKEPEKRLLKDELKK